MGKFRLLIGLIILFLAIIYFAIPPRLVVSTGIKTAANSAGIFRVLSEKKNWEKWWPGKNSMESNNIFLYEGSKFSITNIFENIFKIKVESGKKVDSTFIQFYPKGTDSTIIVWSTLLKTGSNPFTKIAAYCHGRLIRYKMTEILAALKMFISNPVNLYGINTSEQKSPVDRLVSTRQVFPHYPSTDEIYGIIEKVRKYISRFGATEQNFPMVDVFKLDSNHYETEVAIPLKETIAANDTFLLKALPSDAKFLLTAVKGGVGTIEKAVSAQKNYLMDHQRTIMARPFQFLVTDRIKDPDSSKWVTQIYYPIK